MDEHTSQGLDDLTQGVAAAQGASAQTLPDTSADSSSAQGAEEQQSGIERKLSAEAAAYRRKVRELEQKLKQYEEAQLSEQEKLQRRLAELERERAQWERNLQETVLRYEIQLAAQRLGVVDTDAAYKLIDLADVEFDEEGRPTNVETVVRALLQKRPWLAPSSSIPASNPATASSGATRMFTRSQLRDPKFFAEHRDEIYRAVAEGRILED
jgi:molecular chaperone GrpE (heat shock protein)